MKILFDNAAFMGIIGVIIGGFFSVVGVMIQSKYTKKQFEWQKSEYIIREKHSLYLDFFILNGKLQNFDLKSNEISKKEELVKEEIEKKKEEIEKKKAEIEQLNELFKARIQLYSITEIREKAYKILEIKNPSCKEEREKINNKRDKLFKEIIILMKKDLGIKE